MRKKSPKGYVLLACALFLLLSLPFSFVQSWRGAVFAFFSPPWEFISGSHVATSQEEIQRLQLENQLLYGEIERLQECFLSAGFQNGFLDLQMQTIPAKVIYRSASSWNSSLWVNVGFSEYRSIEKNSPVLVGTSVIGVIDYVGKHQCRVRLITDSGLNPSVRVVRGKKKNAALIEHVKSVISALECFEQTDISFSLPMLEETESAYLAKGELHGSSYPLWRSQGQLLKGVGFNYDFADSMGAARDLRSGLPISTPLKRQAIPLVEKGDLLITTGMDGVFPPGLSVATVTTVYPLKEGDYSYELEAFPTAGNLNEVGIVMILPAVGFDRRDMPSAAWLK